mgnify:CR=1 FL=1
MAQLLVRNIEDGLVKNLRKRASADGVSVEEAHRRLLRAALNEGADAPAQTFADYLERIPTDDGDDFERARDLPRDVEV